MEFSYATTTSEAEWADWVTDNAEIQHGGVRLDARTSIRRAELRDRVLDVDVGPDGELYTLGVAGGVYRYDPTTESTDRLRKPTDDSIESPRAICASGNRVFVADGADGTITAISPQLNRTVGTLRAGVAEPSALAYADGTIYALADGDLVAVDRNGAAHTLFEDDLTDPVDIATRDGVRYVLDANDGDPVVRAFGDAEGESVAGFPLTESAFVADGEQFTPTSLSVPAGTLVVGGTFDGWRGHGLFEYDDEAGRFEQRAELDGVVLELVGQSDGGGESTFYAVGGANRTCYALPEVRAYATHPRRNRHVGTALHRYDSGTLDIEWHRLTLGIVRSSASTQVRLRYLATDTPSLLDLNADRIEGLSSAAVETLREAGLRTVWQLVTADAEWVADGDPAIRPSDVRDWQRAGRRALAEDAESRWKVVDEIDPEDVLLDDARGRYLFVAIELVGTPDASPLVDSVRAYCPRTSYLRHLPEIYQADAQSADFLERFLSVFETSFVDVEAEIESITELFDPHAVPRDSLAWLEDWLAVDPDDHWPESARRELLARAPELYKQRGTRAGLMALIDLYLRHANPDYGGTTGRPPTRRTPSTDVGTHTTTGAAAMADGDGTGTASSDNRLFFFDRTDLDGVDTDSVGREYSAHLSGDRSFAVFCDAFASDEQRRAVQAIVDAERPAHVEGRVVTLDDEFTLGDSTFLGLNSELTTREFVMGEGTLGQDTVLTPRDAVE